MREAADTVELAEHSLELRPVAQRDHRADGLAPDHRRHAVRDKDAIPGEQHLVAATAITREDVAHPPRGDTLSDRPSLDRALEPEQATRLVVHERDAAVPVRGHHPFADAVKHRLALLEQRGDVARLETEGLPLEAPREEQRARDPEAECESDVPRDHRHPPKDRPVHLVLKKTD